MKKIIILILLVNINYVYTQDVKNVRELYLSSYNNKSACDSLSNYLNQIEKKDLLKKTLEKGEFYFFKR